MATKLLSCMICPRKPDFSDTSHLLTHVSSKGHLSHLHKLQVRSHQEISAGHQLALYNQWYQEHDLGQLLSERMLQKESKIGVKRQAQIKRQPAARHKSVILSNNVFESPVILVNRKTRINKHIKQPSSSDNESDYASSPVKKTRKHSSGAVNLLSPIKRSLSIEGIHPFDVGSPGAIDPALPVTPESSKLKGVIWPGMDLFDAASEEMRRRRNQKKDVSVLRGMEKTSKLIEPWEVIYSSGGTMIKERFIDGNVDSSSPLRGETPVPKAMAPKKRQPLTRVSGNVPRLTQRNKKAMQPRTMADVRRKASQSRLTRSYVPSSSVGDDFLGSTPRFSPTKYENMEFKLAVGSLGGRKNGSGFANFNDNCQVMAHESAVANRESCNQFNALTNQIYPARPQLSFMTAPWLQPQNQQSQPLHYNNPYMAYRAYSDYQPSQRPVLVKQERFQGRDPMNTPPGDPSEWGYQGGASRDQFPMQTDANNHFFAGFSTKEDPFGYAKNPLSAALEQMAAQAEPNTHGTDGRAFDSGKKKPLSPDGTISDLDNEYEQAIFATSE